MTDRIDPIAAARALLEPLTGYTRGRWQCSRADLASYDADTGAQVSYLYPGDGERVRFETDNPVEDARLAAAAPDLKAACAIALNEIDRLREARAMETERADNLMRERDDALMRLGSLTEHLARLAEAKDHADGEPETDFDRGYDQAGDEIAAMIRDTEHNAQIIVDELLAEARLEGWRAGRDAAAQVAEAKCAKRSQYALAQSCKDAILALREPKEASHD